MLLLLRDGQEVRRLAGVCGEKEIAEAVEGACASM
jgi:hypothetical protein